MVVSPKRGGDYLREASALGVRYVWPQPGTEDESTGELCAKLGLAYVKSCVLVVTGWYDLSQFDPGQGLVHDPGYAQQHPATRTDRTQEFVKDCFIHSL